MPVRPLLLHRMALVSFRLYVLEKFRQLARIFWANGLPPPLAKNFPYAYVSQLLQLWYRAASPYSHFCLVTQRSSSFVGEECCVTRQNTAARETTELSTEVTRRFNRYFINNSNKKEKKKKINFIAIININIDNNSNNNNNNNNNNSNEDLDQLLITEPPYRF